MKKTLRLLVILFAIILTVVIGVRIFLGRQSSPFASAPQPLNYGVLKSFSLTDQNGNTFTPDMLKGSIWVADFIFTRCAGPCPVVTGKMAQLQKEFPASTGVKFVSFSVDPDFDRPEVLKKYADTYKADPARWTFLTGERKTVYDVIKNNFHLVVEPGMSETDIIHSLHHVLIDKDGAILGYFNTADQQDMENLKIKLKALAP